jgi:hypothetical protein
MSLVPQDKMFHIVEKNEIKNWKYIFSNNTYAKNDHKK